MSGITIPEQEKIIIEVVGPGFDASDILRSDLQPHERWEVNIGLTASPPSNESGSPTQIALVTREKYVESVKLRLAKIGARSKNPAFPDVDLGGNSKELDELIQRGTSFLKERRQMLLLRHAEAYIPIALKYISEFVQNVERLLSGLSAYGIHLGSSSFAASVIPKQGLTFWDFFPAKKQEAAALYPVE